LSDTASSANALRVVILNDSSVAKGGATGLATLSARMFSARGIPTTYIAGDGGDDGALAALGVDLIAMGGKLLLDAGKLQAMRAGIFNTEIRDKIAAHIAARDTPGTVYHLHGWSRILSPAVFDALEPVANRTFIHAHDFFLGCPNGAFYDYRKETVCTRTPLSLSCLSTACDRRAFHHKLWRSARSAMLRRTFSKDVPWAKVFALHPGMLPALARSDIPQALLTTVRNPAKPFVQQRITAEANRTFCFVGRVEMGKGINTLCEAARLAEVPLRVIGDGAELDTLRTRYPEVAFTGWVDQADIGAHLKDVRALVMPSRTPEPFGLVAAEASLSGLPVILSQQALLAEEFATQNLGFAADTDTPAALAEVIRKVAALPADTTKDISLRAFAGQGQIAQSPDDWVADLLQHFHKVIPSA